MDKKLALIGAIAMVPKSFPLYITLYLLSPKLSRDTDFRGHSVFGLSGLHPQFAGTNHHVCVYHAVTPVGSHDIVTSWNATVSQFENECVNEEISMRRPRSWLWSTRLT